MEANALRKVRGSVSDCQRFRLPVSEVIEAAKFNMTYPKGSLDCCRKKSASCTPRPMRLPLLYWYRYPRGCRAARKNDAAEGRCATRRTIGITKLLVKTEVFTGPRMTEICNRSEDTDRGIKQSRMTLKTVLRPTYAVNKRQHRNPSGSCLAVARVKVRLASGARCRRPKLLNACATRDNAAAIVRSNQKYQASTSRGDKWSKRSGALRACHVERRPGPTPWLGAHRSARSSGGVSPSLHQMPVVENCDPSCGIRERRDRRHSAGANRGTPFVCSARGCTGFCPL